MAHLFDPLTLRSVTLRNRIGMSPMCQYSSPGKSSADAGQATPWHHTHLVSRAVGGCGLVMVEATAVEPRGRISLADTGLWSDAQGKSWKPIAAQIEAHGAVPAIQLAHAGRKAGTAPPWEGGKPYHASRVGQQPEPTVLSQSGLAAGLAAAQAGLNFQSEPLEGTAAPAPKGKPAKRKAAHEQWSFQSVAPSAIPFDEGWAVPQALTRDEIHQQTELWADAAKRALAAGFKAVELHMAHGYLLHSFYSPLSNHRSDEYGGGFEGRVRFPLELATAVRRAWPEELPLIVRISASDWVPGGWDLAQSVELARRMKAIGVDMIDCSSAANVPHRLLPHSVQQRMRAPLYQVPFAETIRREAGIPTAAVGLITSVSQAQSVVFSVRADMVMLARALLREPYWPLLAAHELKHDLEWPRQYLRARWH